MDDCLPQPTSAALAASKSLIDLINARIASNEGWIPFSEYMELALYAPRLGYYTGGATKLGVEGDFVTGPEISDLYGGTVAQEVLQIVGASRNDILELGAGTGRLAAQILGELSRQGSAPQHYRILEVSGELRARQRQMIAERVPELLSRIEWLDCLPEQIEGAVIANEVLDALPVELVVKGEHSWRIRGVVTSPHSGLHFEDRPVSMAQAASIQAQIPDGPHLEPGYVTELHLAAQGLVRTLVERLHRGALILIDYGFPAREFYHSQRRQGTLMAHYRHRAHADPFLWPGLQDLTAHVDFSAIARSAFEAGGEILGYTTQAHFLLNCGILDRLKASPDEAGTWLVQSNAIQRLLSEAEMGELFKVMVVGRGIDPPLRGFARGERSAAL